MAVSFLQRSTRLSNHFKRYLSAAVTAVPLSEPISDITSFTTSPSIEISQSVQISKLSNGLTVASVDSLMPYTSLSVYVKCGARVESYGEQGLTHLFRNCAFLSNKSMTGFLLQREIDQLGGTLSCSTSREHIIYSTNCLKDYQGQTLSAIGKAVTEPEFFHWEVNEQFKHVELDTIRASADPSTVVFELLHKNSFRSGLSNSIYCPPYNVTKFTNNDLIDFHKNWFVSPHITVVGVGIDHEALVNYTNESFSGAADGVKKDYTKSDYVGGNEVRVDAGGTGLAHVGVVCKGASLYGSHDHVAGILEQLLGGGARVKWGSGSATARLNKAVATTVDEPFAVNAFNVSYSDNGLFGIYAVADGAVMGKVLKASMREFSEVAKGNFTSDDFLRAKNQYKSSLLMRCEHELVREIGTQASLNGTYQPIDDRIKAIDNITAQDVISFSKIVYSTRPTVVAHGNLSATPRLDELLTSLS